MNKPKKMLIPAAELVLMIKDREDWQLGKMIASIIAYKEVLLPLVISSRDGEYKVMIGNRRVKAVQQMLCDLTTPKDVRDNIKMLKCLVYEGLTSYEEDLMMVETSCFHHH